MAKAGKATLGIGIITSTQYCKCLLKIHSSIKRNTQCEIQKTLTKKIRIGQSELNLSSVCYLYDIVK